MSDILERLRRYGAKCGFLLTDPPQPTEGMTLSADAHAEIHRLRAEVERLTRERAEAWTVEDAYREGWDAAEMYDDVEDGWWHSRTRRSAIRQAEQEVKP